MDFFVLGTNSYFAFTCNSTSKINESTCNWQYKFKWIVAQVHVEFFCKEFTPHGYYHCHYQDSYYHYQYQSPDECDKPRCENKNSKKFFWSNLAIIWPQIWIPWPQNSGIKSKFHQNRSQNDDFRTLVTPAAPSFLCFCASLYASKMVISWPILMNFGPKSTILRSRNSNLMLNYC